MAEYRIDVLDEDIRVLRQIFFESRSMELAGDRLRTEFGQHDDGEFAMQLYMRDEDGIELFMEFVEEE